jgi:methylmalonyl-CoA epimerase
MKLHHIAIVVSSIEEKLLWYQKIYDAVSIGERYFIDENQKVKVQFIQSNNLKIELLEPTGEDSPIRSHLEKHGSGSLYHIAYEVDDLDETAIEIRKKKGIVISRSTNGWNGMQVMFAMFFNKNEAQLVEYIKQ